MAPFLKQNIHSISKQYTVKLREHLRKGHTPPRGAEQLGKDARLGGLTTRDLAEIHGRAFLTLVPMDGTLTMKEHSVKEAVRFYLGTSASVVRPADPNSRNIAKLERYNKSLKQRTVELGAAIQRLKIEVGHRKAAEQSLRESEQNHRQLLKEARLMQMRLRDLSHQILSAQEKERKEISRELHDEVVQTLTGINVHLASLKIESGLNKKNFSKHINYTQRLVARSVDIVHRFARDLRPNLLDDLGLIPALHAYMKSFTERTGVRVELSAFAAIETLSNDKRTVFYRVAQAALTNIAQHAHATAVTVKIKQAPHLAVLVIKDDGASFNVAQVLDSRKNKRLGLVGMRERVEMVGGHFQVQSKPGYGTTITASVPFKPKAES